MSRGKQKRQVGEHKRLEFLRRAGTSDRIFLASSEGIKDQQMVQERLATDRNIVVRLRLAANPVISGDAALFILRNEQEESVVKELFENRHVDAAPLKGYITNNLGNIVTLANLAFESNASGDLAKLHSLMRTGMKLWPQITPIIIDKEEKPH